MTDNASFIVTGGAGFIGSNLVAALNARGLTDILVADELNHSGKERNLFALEYREYLDKDELRKRVADGSLDRVDTVFHLGACSSTTEMDEAYLADNNCAYTQELCRWSLENRARFVYASSAATYGDGTRGYDDNEEMVPTLQPLNPYGESKQKVDRWALETGLFDRIVGIKYFNVYGPGEDHKGDMRSMINKAYAHVVEKGTIGLFKSYRPDYADGEQKRDFVDVRDAVAVTLFFHDHPEVSGLFNCGTGTARTWIDLATALFVAMDRAPRIEFIEMPETIRDKYQYFTEARMQKLRSAGYRAPFRSIEDGVRDYVCKYLVRS
jgi:ADP-L-glycero-D-manno-heptose 6-epimerase